MIVASGSRVIDNVREHADHLTPIPSLASFIRLSYSDQTFLAILLAAPYLFSNTSPNNYPRPSLAMVSTSPGEKYEAAAARVGSGPTLPLILRFIAALWQHLVITTCFPSTS
jgi:hypothetical protein